MLTSASRRGVQGIGALCRRQARGPASAVSAPQVASEEWLRARPFEEIPGPKSLPIIGNALSFLAPSGEFHNKDIREIMFHQHRVYGNIVRMTGLPGRPPMVFVYDLVDIEKVYRNEGPRPVRDNFPSMTYYRGVLRRDRFGDAQGLAFTQGEEWYNFRTKVNQHMMQPRATKLYVPSIDNVAQDFVNRMIALRDENMKMPSDFLNELYKWALESISLIALDTRLGCLEGNLPVDSEAQRMIQAAHTMFECMEKLDMKLSPWKYISTPSWRRLVKALDCIYEVSIRHVNEAMERIKARGVADVSQGELSVLEKLLLSNDDPMIACVMALDMMNAGIDTTANSTAIAMYFLSKNPEAQEKLYNELRSQLPESVSQPLTSEKLEACKYLKACVKESMRLRPVAIGGGRRVVVNNLVLSNYRIPRGVDVVVPNVVLTNSEEHFPQPSQYLPERWLKGGTEGSAIQTAHPFAFMPFGFGRRTCIGRRFAELEIHTLLARIFRRFWVEYEGEMQWKMAVLQSPAAPLTFKVTVRQN